MSTESVPFEEFWRDYVRKHRHPLTQRIHAAGTLVGLAIAVGGLVGRRPTRLLWALFAGYGPAWLSHWLVESNQPATFEHPLWSFRADLRMIRQILQGTMGAEVERACGSDPVKGSDQPTTAPTSERSAPRAAR
jgi:hypothetical protein